MRSPIRVIFDWYMDHLIARSKAKNAKFRELQMKANRTGAKVMRYVIFDDIHNPEKTTDMITYTVRVVDGSLERLPDEVKPDVTIYTDVPTVYGIMNNRAVIYPNGKEQVISPFGVWDGVRLGRIVWDGETTALKDLYLFDRNVLPLIEEQLRIRKIER